MKIIELLKKIDCGEIKDGTIFHGGDLFYKMIVADKKLFVINETLRELTLVDSELIGNFITQNYDIYEYKKIME